MASRKKNGQSEGKPGRKRRAAGRNNDAPPEQTEQSPASAEQEREERNEAQAPQLHDLDHGNDAEQQPNRTEDEGTAPGLAKAEDHGPPVEKSLEETLLLEDKSHSHAPSIPTGHEPPKESETPVVVIGASAGGLEALEEFFTNMPADSGIVFVVITHTDPGRPSLLPGLLQNKTAMKVCKVVDGVAVQPNVVYVPPSDKDLAFEDGVFRLTEIERPPGLKLPIDAFLKTLSIEKRERAACIIISGTGSDGSQGLRLIKEKGGMVMAQLEATARYTGMPRSAEDTGLVDFVLPPAEMPRQLIQYFKHPASLDKEKKALEEGQLPMVLRKIITVLGNRTGHDFSTYKKSTLVRRIERRMSVRKIEYASQYLDYLHRNPSEIETLFQELLIGVTSFFRDPEAFDYLKTEVLPDLLTATDHDHAFRVWVPGCATGEEVYSIAIILHECMERLSVKREVQIFGTDIDRFAVEKAREGVDPKNIAVDVTKERLERFFTKDGDLYKVRKDVREGAVFAVQNILKDPPFSNLDLLMCRNLLIYLEPKAQKKLIPLFHYTLKPEGVLFLGTSESIGGFTDLFTPLSKKWSLYRKRDINAAVRPMVEFPTRGWTYQPSQDQFDMAAQVESAGEAGIALAVERLLLRRYTPSCVIVDPKGERTSRYLELAQGRPEFHVLSMAREGLRFPLASAMRQAVSSNEEVVRDGLRVESDDGLQIVKLTIKPLHTPESLKGLILVLFEDSSLAPEPTGAIPQADEGSEKQRALDLERELARTQQDYRSALEELETSNEELKSVNEEIQSANEEFQSTNEELESSREELQSLNEELTTVNAELHEKIVELSDAYSTITDVLNSTRVAILVLDNEFLVRRFTTEARNVINLIEADIGRPISDISTNLDYDGLDRDFQNVIESLAPKEREVRTKDGHWHLMRIIPYRTKDNRLNGVVVTFVNIDAQKDAQMKVEQLSKDAVLSAMRYAESIVDTVRESLLVLDTDFRVLSANRSFYNTFRVSAEETEGKPIFDLGDRQWDIPMLRELLERISGPHSSFEDFEVEHTFPRVGHKRMLLNARRLLMETDGTEKILLAIEDVTETRRKDGS